MPKSKHRRKAGEKAVPHPGRGRKSPLRLAWADERREELPVRRDLHATEEIQNGAANCHSGWHGRMNGGRSGRSGATCTPRRRACEACRCSRPRGSPSRRRTAPRFPAPPRTCIRRATAAAATVSKHITAPHSTLSFGGSNRLGVGGWPATIAETECIERWHACYHSRAGNVDNLDVPQSQAPCICVECRNENGRQWALSQKMPPIAPSVQPPIAPVSGRHHWSGWISRSELYFPV